jgi:peptide chain release factor subunit 1
MSEVHSGRGLGIYGLSDVIRSLKDGVAEMVILTDDINYIHFHILDMHIVYVRIHNSYIRI